MLDVLNGEDLHQDEHYWEDDSPNTSFDNIYRGDWQPGPPNSDEAHVNQRLDMRFDQNFEYANRLRLFDETPQQLPPHPVSTNGTEPFTQQHLSSSHEMSAVSDESPAYNWPSGLEYYSDTPAGTMEAAPSAPYQHPSFYDFEDYSENQDTQDGS